MGLKIYNGFRLPMMDVGSLQGWAETVRAKVHNVHDRLFLRWAAETAAQNVDSVVFASSREEVKSYISTTLPGRKVSMRSSVGAQAVWSCYCSEIEYDKSSRRHKYDLSASMVLFPTSDHLLARLFAERGEYGRAIRGLPGLERYDFWHGDPPTGVTQRDWKQRGDEWEAVLRAGPTPAQAGVTIELTRGRIFLPKLDTVARYLPSFRHRVRSAVERLIVDEHPEPDEATRKSIPKLFQFVRAWDVSPEGVLARARVQEAVERRLPRRIGLEELCQSPMELFERFHSGSA